MVPGRSIPRTTYRDVCRGNYGSSENLVLIPIIYLLQTKTREPSLIRGEIGFPSLLTWRLESPRLVTEHLAV
jgi:hypothetical protein